MAFGIKERFKEGDKPKPTRWYSNKQEKATAKKLNGKCTSNSGATDFGGKGDILLDSILLECKTKTTSSKSISIKKEWFKKNTQEAIFMGKPYSALAFNFGPDEENYYIINEELFEILINKIKEGNN